jgi:hypothetical protein
MATTSAATAITYNTDIDGLVRRINRFITETFLAQSSGVSKTASFDVTRMKSYTKAIRQYIGWVVSVPLLDLPETGPRSLNLPVSPIVPPMENESMYDVAILLELARDELVNSQSSRMSSNLLSYDQARITAILDKIDNFIDGFITAVDPLDLPDSSPMVKVTGGGLSGV